MRRTLEAIFRRPLLLLIPILLLPIIGVAFEYYTVPRTYQATASIWALQRYFVVGATGPESDLTSTPAETQATALNEFLQTRTFAMSVAQGIDLAPTLGLSGVANDSQIAQDSIYSDISKHVVATPVAYNLYLISYTNKDPATAQEVVKSVIAKFGSQGPGFSVAGAQNLLTGYQTQLANAQKTLDEAISSETHYAAIHPDVKLGSDPEYELLDTQRLQALTNVQNIQNTINTIQQSIFNTQGTGTNTLFQVIDPPQQPNRPASRTKDYILGGGMGLGIALLACIVYLVIVVRRNRGVYSDRDLQDLVSFPVVMQLPTLTPAAVSLLAKKTVPGQALLTDRKSSANGHVTGS